MKVKRFVAENMRLALKQVREEMGPEAVILSNKRVPEGVELLTAIEEPTVASGQEAPRPVMANRSGNPFADALEDSQTAARTEKKTSLLELEVERMQREAKQRAEALAAVLAEKNRQQLEQAISAEAIAEQAFDDAQLRPDQVALNKHYGAEDAPSAAAEYQAAVTAADSGERETTADEVKATATEASTHYSFADAFKTSTGRPVTDSGSEQELSQMRFELQSMRDLLEHQLSNLAWGQYSQQNPQRASIWKRFKRIGIGAGIANELLENVANESGGQPLAQLTAHNWQNMMQDLSDRLPVAEGDLMEAGGCFAFVGPTGAGKTTTIGKLATRYVLKHGAEGVALVTTDVMRIAGHEQLRTFGRILNVPVKVVDKHNSLERVLHSLRHKSLVLIDTAGLNRQDAALVKQLNSLNELGNRINTVLVIPTTSQLQVIKAAYHTYKTDNLAACVLTKLDETASLGEVLTLAIEKSLAIAYSTHGQAIPNDIVVADSRQLLREAIDLAKQVTADDAAMAEEYSSLSRRKSESELRPSLSVALG